jgi:N6-adenosine-specific RNA methylase IME4
VKPYRCIVADPPWMPRDKLPGKTRGAARQYDVLPTSDICAFLDTHEVAVADDAILFLWRLASMQQDALDVARAWGFDVKSEIVWQKLTKNGLPWFGMGRTVRASHETCLICVRGRASRLIVGKAVRSTFTAMVPFGPDCKYIHSAKPDAFFRCVVDPLVGQPHAGGAGPYLELFARKHRDGWDAIGNQLPVRERAA